MYNFVAGPQEEPNREASNKLTKLFTMILKMCSQALVVPLAHPHGRLRKSIKPYQTPRMHGLCTKTTI